MLPSHTGSQLQVSRWQIKFNEVIQIHLQDMVRSLVTFYNFCCVLYRKDFENKLVFGTKLQTVLHLFDSTVTVARGFLSCVSRHCDTLWSSLGGCQFSSSVWTLQVLKVVVFWPTDCLETENRWLCEFSISIKQNRWVLLAVCNSLPKTVLSG